MTTTSPQPELEAEQEVDFRRYRALLAARWWLLAAGLVAGVVVGWLLAVSGGSVWRAQALVSLGQPFSPNGGSPVASFLTDPRAVSEIVSSETAQRKAARAAGMRQNALRGNVSSKQVGTGPGASRGAPLMSLTVQGKHPAKVEKAVDSLANTVVQRTTAPYVGAKIANLKKSLASIQSELNTVAPRITALEQVVDSDKTLSGLNRVLVATQLDNAEQRRGQLLDQQATAQLQLALAEHVESARVIEPGTAVKTTARSHRTSMLVGGLIGLILGGIAAVLWQPLAARASTHR